MVLNVHWGQENHLQYKSRAFHYFWLQMNEDTPTLHDGILRCARMKLAMETGNV